MIVGSIGLGINIIGLFLFQGFHGHSHDDTKPQSELNNQTDVPNDNYKKFERHSSRALSEVRFEII